MRTVISCQKKKLSSIDSDVSSSVVGFEKTSEKLSKIGPKSLAPNVTYVIICVLGVVGSRWFRFRKVGFLMLMALAALAELAAPLLAAALLLGLGPALLNAESADWSWSSDWED